MEQSKIQPDYQEPNENISKKRSLMYLAIIGFLVTGVVISIYIYLTQDQVYVEKSTISAPSIDLSSQNGGVLERIMVQVGDTVSENTPVAQVGQEIVKAKVAGVIISTQDSIGKTFSPGEAVVSEVHPEDLRVVAQVEEDKGLSAIKVGQKAIFTVDAFGSKKFEGIVDEISPSARQGDVVFDISSQRQLNDFNVKIRFDENKYPELKNGMSAKSWIYKN
jgi:multidrug resistance efflux pump